MHTHLLPNAIPLPEDPVTTIRKYPFCAELGPELARLEHEERIQLDRKRQQALQRQRAVQDKD